MTSVAGPSFSLRAIVILLALAGFTLACARFSTQTNPSSRASTGTPVGNVFDNYLNADPAPADGFDFPFGRGDGGGAYEDRATGKKYDGWYVATRFAENYSLGIHPGEDWNGTGGGNTDLGQEVFAVANGRAVFAAYCGRLWGNVIILEHVFYENHERKTIRSLYAHLEKIHVQAGEAVRRRQLIATVGQDPEKLFNAHLHLEFRWDETLEPTYWPTSNQKDVGWVRQHYAEPSLFIRSHRKLPVPQVEPLLVLVDQSSYKMRLYQRNKLLKEYEVSFGQGSGPKLQQGDNKTPVGMYFVVQKHKGKFDGAYGEYYGGHWIKINYPNQFDAVRAEKEGLINSSQATSIAKNWEARALTAQDTRLGGGIGFHGWIREWPNDGPRHLSWGCVVMHLSDIGSFFDQVPDKTMVVIF